MLYEISSRIYLDKINHCYMRYITIHNMPTGLLSNYVIRINHNKLSIFDVEPQCNKNNYSCYYVISNPKTKQPFTINEVPELISFLLSLNYSINTSITKLLTKNPRTNHSDQLLFYISEN